MKIKFLHIFGVENLLVQGLQKLGTYSPGLAYCKTCGSSFSGLLLLLQLQFQYKVC